MGVKWAHASPLCNIKWTGRRRRTSTVEYQSKCSLRIFSRWLVAWMSLEWNPNFKYARWFCREGVWSVVWILRSEHLQLQRGREDYGSPKNKAALTHAFTHETRKLSVGSTPSLSFR